MGACATSCLREREYSGLVGVAFWALCRVSLSGFCELHYGLTMGGGAEDDLLIVTSIQSGLSWVAPVELLDSVSCLVPVYCLVSDFVVFW